MLVNDCNEDEDMLDVILGQSATLVKPRQRLLIGLQAAHLLLTDASQEQVIRHTT